jgi:hypothetical protein
MRRWVALAACAAVAAATLAVAWPAEAQPAGGGGTPTYQRKGTFAGGWQGQQDGNWQGHQNDWQHRQVPRQFSSQTNAGSFQRPYPFHLDYYRMKWGGSYAPYFGNLYGPPNYFFNGTPFFGGFAPSYGYGGFNGGWNGGFNGGWNGGFDSQFGGPGGPGYFGSTGGGGVPFGPWAQPLMDSAPAPVDRPAGP